MRTRIERVEAAPRRGGVISRVFVTEWLGAAVLRGPLGAGHGRRSAGGTDVVGMSGEPSYRMRWTDVAALDPEVVVLAPCGFDLDRTLSEVVPLELSAHLLGTPARQESRVFAVDANGSSPAPARGADGVQAFGTCSTRATTPTPGAPWSRIRTLKARAFSENEAAGERDPAKPS